MKTTQEKPEDNKPEINEETRLRSRSIQTPNPPNYIKLPVTKMAWRQGWKAGYKAAELQQELRSNPPMFSAIDPNGGFEERDLQDEG